MQEQGENFCPYEQRAGVVGRYLHACTYNLHVLWAEALTNKSVGPGKL